MEKMIETPELYAYKIDPDAWAKKMIALGTRDKQWDLVVESVGTEIYTFPLFTEEFCNLITEHAEKTGKWTKARHKFYPTTDILLEDIGLKVVKAIMTVIAFVPILWILSSNILKKSILIIYIILLRLGSLTTFDMYHSLKYSMISSGLGKSS